MWHQPMDLVVPLGEASYFLRAVTPAGQESADSQAVTVTLSCEQTSPEQPDAGTNMPDPDGAAEQDAAQQEAAPQQSGGSCSLTAVGGQGADLPLAHVQQAHAGSAGAARALGYWFLVPALLVRQ